MTNRIKELAKKYSSVIMSAREHFHANPGIEFQEFETTKKISSKYVLYEAGKLCTQR